MADLRTTYMGIKLDNPLIVASCSLTKSIEGIKRVVDSGAGAVVLKSLFEEQIKSDVEEVKKYIGPSWHYEAYDYVNKMGMELGPEDYLRLIEKSKKTVKVPVIASLNCISSGWWREYAKKIELAGADALELNIAYLTSNPKLNSNSIEKLYCETVDSVSSSIGIPLAVKLGPYFTSFSRLATELCSKGARALVLFNRYYQFDIDIKNLKLVAGNYLSEPLEMNLPLRWITLLFDQVKCDLSATTGVHSSSSVIKLLLAGARTVQLCSVLYKKGVEYLENILNELKSWMDEEGYTDLEEIRGKLSKQRSSNPELYERLQYIKALVGIE